LGIASVKAEAGGASPGATRHKLQEPRRSLEAGSLKLEAASLKLEASCLKLQSSSLKLGEGRPKSGSRRATRRSARTYGVCPSWTTRQAKSSRRLGQVLGIPAGGDCGRRVRAYPPPPAAAFLWGAGKTTAPTRTTTKLLVKCRRWFKRLWGKALRKCLHELTRFVKAGSAGSVRLEGGGPQGVARVASAARSSSRGRAGRA